MQVQELSRPDEFLSQVREFLIKQEDINNLPLGILMSLTAVPPSQPPFLAYVTERGQICLAMVMTTGHLVLAGEEEDWRQAIEAATVYLSQRNLPISGIIGPRAPAELFARMWKPLRTEVEMEQGIYRLDTVNPIPHSSGSLRLAQSKDQDLLRGWIEDFCREALAPISREQARKMAETGIASKTFFLWEDGEAVSMVKKTRPTFNGVALNQVYTPKQYRNHGYASSSVASLCSLLLAEYKFCCLYTDLANPTSNKIYRKIGFRPVAESVSIRFP